MNDMLGSEITVGNAVIMAIPDYAGLCLCRVIKITPKKIRVQYNNTWNYAKGHLTIRLVDPENLCKIEGQDATAYILRNGL